MLFEASTELALDHTRTWKITRNIRAGLSLVFLVGLCVVGSFHAGPREAADGTIAIHFTGAAVAMFGGNINSVLSAFLAHPVRTEKLRHYRAISLFLGVTGIIAGLCTEAASKAGYTGIIERISVYCILTWGMATSITVWAQHTGNQSGNIEKVKNG